MKTQLIAPLTLGALALACGGSERHTHSHPPMSAEHHLADAEEHEVAADQAAQQYQPEEGSGSSYECYDQSLAPDPTSGTETVRLVKPCWQSEQNPNAEFLRVAERERSAAADHRKRAAELLDAERKACEGIGEEEISHSPFFHRDDIAGFEEIRENGKVVGVRTRFNKVPGLTREWMAKAVACHQARAAVMGYNPRYMSYCPLMLPSVAAAVTEEDGKIVVSLRSTDSVSAAAVLGRVQDLVE